MAGVVVNIQDAMPSSGKCSRNAPRHLSDPARERVLFMSRYRLKSLFAACGTPSSVLRTTARCALSCGLFW